LISQGVPGQQMMAKLDAANLPKTAAGFWQYLTADPVGAGQKEIIDIILKSAQTQKEVAQGQIKEYVIPTLKVKQGAGLPDTDRKNIMAKYDINDDEYNNWKKGSIVNQIVQNQSPPGAAGAGQQRMPASVGGGQQPTVTVRRKADGKTKVLAADQAMKYLSDPGYEKVQ